MVPSRASLPPLQRRLFASGSPALDVVHTGGVGDWVALDLVHDEADLAHWLGVLLEREVADGPGLPVFRAVREAVYGCTRTLLAGRPHDARDVAVLNRLALGPALPVALDPSGAYAHPVAGVEQAVAHLAREAVGLLGGPLASRVRECAAPDCRLLFVDTSRPGRRQWCSMARCGNLAKTRAYRGRGSA